MMNSLLMKLGTLMCVLAVHADVMPVKDFDLEKMAGDWYVVGYASNAKWFVDSKEETKLGTQIFKPGHDGHMDLVYVHNGPNGTSSNSTFHAMKTDTPGRFTYHSDIWKNDNDMRIVEVQYEDYALVHTIKTTSDNSTHILNNLLSRTNGTSAALQEKFSKFSNETGVLPENILLLPRVM
uniref:Prostaglandin D synthase n=1 Tax=Platichthys flesus TaxID=8260 RepID=H1ZRL4_PLAFE|nr:prostaglandin D synthase [Platichthys flesus]CBA10402.1 prostaglandin D synthase [Platichthys flesus]